MALQMAFNPSRSDTTSSLLKQLTPNTNLAKTTSTGVALPVMGAPQKQTVTQSPSNPFATAGQGQMTPDQIAAVFKRLGINRPPVPGTTPPPPPAVNNVTPNLVKPTPNIPAGKANTGFYNPNGADIEQPYDTSKMVNWLFGGLPGIADASSGGKVVPGNIEDYILGKPMGGNVAPDGGASLGRGGVGGAGGPVANMPVGGPYQRVDQYDPLTGHQLRVRRIS